MGDMTRADEMDALAERVEKLTGADREVDADIARAIGALGRFAGWPNKGLVSPELSIVPKYTSSLDAAMSLVPEGLEWHVSNSTTRRLPNNTPEHFHGWAGVYGGPIIGSECDSFGFIPALALTAACLRAQASLIREAGR